MRPPTEKLPEFCIASNAPSLNAFPQPVTPLEGGVVPPIDIATLPPILRDFVQAVSECIQVPSEIVFAAALAACAICTQRFARVEIHNDYSESLNLYLLSALGPGERKSPTVTICKQPLCAWEEKQREKMKDVRSKADADRKSFERIIEAKRSFLPKAKTAEERAKQMDEIQKLEADLPVVPAIPRLFIDDATPEAVAAMLAEHNELLAMLEAEGGLFDILSGRYSQGSANIDLFLKCWSGGTMQSGSPQRRSQPAF